MSRNSTSAISMSDSWGTRSANVGVKNLSYLFAWLPIPLVLAYTTFYYVFLPSRPIDNLLGEGGIIESATFVFALLGGCFGLFYSWQLRKARARRHVVNFYFSFSGALMLVGFEEVSWGQHIFHFKTPDFYKDINAQSEFNLHYIKGWSGTNSVLRIIFGLGGLLGIWLGSFAYFKPLAPSKLLIVWFAVIALCAIPEGILDLLNERDGNTLHFISSYLAEFNEMLVTTTAALYLILNRFGRAGVADQR